MPDEKLEKKYEEEQEAPELATSSGLSINSATYWLNKIAGETGAKLEVANDGTVYYSFAPNFSGVYRRRGRRRAALLAGAFLFKSLYWVVRVSFGVALMTSVLVHPQRPKKPLH